MIDLNNIDHIDDEITGVVQDKDRVRLIRTHANSFNFTSEQVKRLVKAQHYGESKIQTAILCYPNTTDKQNYQMVVDEFYDNEKNEIKSKLNIK
ncbi:hypothetical protein DLAC_08024 [Tieghemostelium lacteum]|uniref:DUF4476 domain-containing protein n=1 Tax=Tieghemostelium lacteum TaxID=361077 RepID=A0A151ZB08_TIELA|nr:hypothetical protein DLAC_08024 [Tieghemostelium lacteum]|eukprot:KYQ91118.1 hypothetical protein DLAC_08024 [Tieghemostelium lacteum]